MPSRQTLSSPPVTTDPLFSVCSTRLSWTFSTRGGEEKWRVQESYRRRRERKEKTEGGERERALVSVVDLCGETRRGREKLLWRKSDILLRCLNTVGVSPQSSFSYIYNSTHLWHGETSHQSEAADRGGMFFCCFQGLMMPHPCQKWPSLIRSETGWACHTGASQHLFSYHNIRNSEGRKMEIPREAKEESKKRVSSFQKQVCNS